MVFCVQQSRVRDVTAEYQLFDPQHGSLFATLSNLMRRSGRLLRFNAAGTAVAIANCKVKEEVNLDACDQYLSFRRPLAHSRNGMGYERAR